LTTFSKDDDDEDEQAALAAVSTRTYRGSEASILFQACVKHAQWCHVRDPRSTTTNTARQD